MQDIVIDVSPSRFFRWLKKASRSLLLAYVVWIAVLMWAAESINRQQVSFREECAATGGIITWGDQRTSCTRMRAMNGTFQL